MDSIKLYLQTKICVQQSVRSTGYHLGLGNGNWGSYPPSIHLRETDLSEFLVIFWYCFLQYLHSLKEMEMEKGPYQNSAVLLQFNHSEIRQVDSERTNIGHLRLTTFLILSHYPE